MSGMAAVIRAAARRQKILDALNYLGAMRLAELALYVCESKYQTSIDLNTAQTRGEAVYIKGGRGKAGKWHAVAKAATFADPHEYKSKAAETKMREQQDKARERAVPGLRVVRLLDKPASRTDSGGQAVRRDHGSLQCNLNERSVQL